MTRSLRNALSGVREILAQLAPASLKRRTIRYTSALIAVLLLTVACGASDQTDSDESAQGEVLTIGHSLQPNSIDPARVNGAMLSYVGLAYDSLVNLAPDGSLEPRLAESWEYIGDGNVLFEFRLRPDVTFSDGSPLTAEVVRANIEYYKEAGGEAAAALATIEKIEVVDDLTIRLHLSEPNPTIPLTFTWQQLAGNMISGEALENPEVLATETFGAGPYILDADRTVANDHYTYVVNPDYWNPDSQNWRKIVIKVLPNANTALSALQTGQIDVMSGSPDTAEAAVAAGINVVHAPQAFVGLAFADRTGELAPPLGDVRVRQAVNFALDREKITAALYGDYGSANEQILREGQPGRLDGTFYTYNPDRARELLEEAGYADGLTFDVLTNSVRATLAQAIAAELEKVGIKLNIVTAPDIPTFTEDMADGKYPAFTIGFGSFDMHTMGPRLFLRDAMPFNARKTEDAQLQAWYDEAASADPDTQKDLYEQMQQRILEEAWFAPVSFIDNLTYTNDRVAGVDNSPARPGTWPLEWRPAE